MNIFLIRYYLNKLKKTLNYYFLYYFPKALFASSENIRQNTNLKTNTSMIGVNVLVKELGVGTVSDEQGEYIIVNIKPGIYHCTTLAFQKSFSKMLLSIKIEPYTKIFNSKRKLWGQRLLKQLGYGHKDLTASQKLLHKRNSKSTSRIICRCPC